MFEIAAWCFISHKMKPITTASKTSNIFWEYEKEPGAVAWALDSFLIRHLWVWKEHRSPTFRHTRAGPLPESLLMLKCRYDGRIYSNSDWSRMESISKKWPKLYGQSCLFRFIYLSFLWWMFQSLHKENLTQQDCYYSDLTNPKTKQIFANQRCNTCLEGVYCRSVHFTHGRKVEKHISKGRV